MNTLFLVLVILCAFNQAIGIGGGSWFEGKRSPKKRSIQCGIRWHGQSNCGFKRLRLSLSDLSKSNWRTWRDFFYLKILPFQIDSWKISTLATTFLKKKQWKNFEHILLPTNTSVSDKKFDENVLKTE